MKRWALLALASPLLCGPAAAQERNAIARLESCVIAKAEMLEISHEPADIVAEAAVAKCSKELTLATPDAGLLRSNADARNQLKAAMREAAIVRVVDIRADRALNPPPPAKKKK